MFLQNFNKKIFKHKFDTLAERFSLIFISIFIIFAIIAIIIINQLLSEFFLNYYENQNKILISYFLKIISPLIERYDYWGVELNCRKLLEENKNILYIYVFNEENVIINNTISLYDYEDNLNIDEIKLEIINKKGKIIGFLRAGLNQSFIDRELKKTRYLFFSLSLLAIVIFVIIIFNINKKFIASSLKNLSIYINKLSQTNFEEKIEYKENVKELISIYDSFERLRQNLKEKIFIINNIIDNLPYPLVMIDDKFNIQRINKQFIKMFNFVFKDKKNLLNIEEQLISNISLFEFSDYFYLFEKDIKKVLYEGESIKINNLKIENENFKNCYHNIDIFPLKYSFILGAIIIIQDKTEEVKNVEIVNRVQKLESLGVLASGIAHDFNNILAGIKGSISLIEMDLNELLEKYKDDDNLNSLFENFNILKTSTERATNVINQLFLFTRKYSINRTIFNLESSIVNIFKLCNNTFSKDVSLSYINNIDIQNLINYFERSNLKNNEFFIPIKDEIITKINKKEYLFYGIQDRIEQSLLNIMINGYHAMTTMKKENELKGGNLKLFLEIKDKEFVYRLKFIKDLKEELNKDYLFENENFNISETVNILDFANIENDEQMQKELNKIAFYYKIAICDEGVGIEKENIEKIFDPFFTTKDRSVSSGIGLSMVYNIVKDHFGYIDVYSIKNKGTVFILYLPAYYKAFGFDLNEELLIKSKDIKDKNGKGFNIEIFKKKDKDNLKKEDFDKKKKFINNKIKSVLIIDDEEHIRYLIKKFFTKYDIEVIEANDSQSAYINFYENINRFNIIMIDYVIPKENGVIVFNKIKDQIDFNKTKVIFSTGLYLNEEVQNVIDNKNVFLISKPYNFEQFSKLIFDIAKMIKVDSV